MAILQTTPSEVENYVRDHINRIGIIGVIIIIAYVKGIFDVMKILHCGSFRESCLVH